MKRTGLVVAATFCLLGCGADPPAHELKAQPLAGLRVSQFSVKDRPPEYYAGSAGRMSEAVRASRPGNIWIVGLCLDNGRCRLAFPGSAGRRRRELAFADSDLVGPYLDAFDRAGLKVWLEVEPGNADVCYLVDAVLGRYGSHSCVAGFGVDLEWYRRSASDPRGRPVTDTEAGAWLARVLRHNPAYRLFLKHWRADHMPPSLRRGIVFVCDSQGFRDFEAMREEFANWGRTFRPASAAFQFGYERDRAWWSKMADPPSRIASGLLEAIDNCVGVFWVDFTLALVFPH